MGFCLELTRPRLGIAAGARRKKKAITFLVMAL
jgi:hypothetical protein